MTIDVKDQTSQKTDPTPLEDTPLTIADQVFTSRLILGTGKFASHPLMHDALKASGTELVTMALKRISIENPADRFIEAFKSLHIRFLPNTAGARTADDALRIARLAKAASGHTWIKLEVTPNPKHLLPDSVETFKAAKMLIKENFTVLPYIHADPVLAKQLEEIGCATVMPLGSPIGSNRGLRTRDLLEIIIAEASIPVVVDAGIGAPSHAARAMEMGADAVLVNTAIATADHPIWMAEAFKYAVHAGRRAYLAKLPPIRSDADASSPLPEFLNH